MVLDRWVRATVAAARRMAVPMPMGGGFQGCLPDPCVRQRSGWRQ